MNDFSESEMIAHAFGMKACILGKTRYDNPYDHNNREPMDILLCRAWFTGWDDANRGKRLLTDADWSGPGSR